MSFIGESGFPVGVFPDAVYEVLEFRLGRGDRLYLYSDGVTECRNGDSEMFTTERLVGLLEKGRVTPLGKLMRHVEGELHRWRGGEEFEDDVTLLALERP